MRQFVLRILAAAIARLSTVDALAHAHFDPTVPPIGGTVAASPPEIRLFFSEAIEPRVSGIELATIDGRPVRTGPANVEPGDPTQYVLLVPALPPGRYQVTWPSSQSTPTRREAISLSRSSPELGMGRVWFVPAPRAAGYSRKELRCCPNPSFS